MSGASGAATGRAEAARLQLAARAGESPEWQTASHFVGSAAACANALAKLVMAERRAIPSSQGAARRAAQRNASFRSEAFGLCDELRDCEQKARAALERAFAGMAEQPGVKAPGSIAEGQLQASASGSKRTLKRRQLRKQKSRAKRAAAGDQGDVEMAGEKPPS